MIEIIYFIAFVTSNVASFLFAYKLGIKTEQRARIRRLNTLKRLLNGKI